MAHSIEAGYVSPALSQRAVVFMAIIAFHVVLVYLFASGLAARTMQLVLEPIEVMQIPDPPKTARAPPPAVVEYQPPPRIDLGPPPDVVIDVPSDPATTISTSIGPAPTVVPPPVQRVEPLRLVGRHQLPNTEDYYPASERRLGIEGSPEVNVCVDERGKRTGDPTITRSSGNAHFDEAALKIARAGKFARSARGETFVPNCYGFRIVFTMQK